MLYKTLLLNYFLKKIKKHYFPLIIKLIILIFPFYAIGFNFEKQTINFFDNNKTIINYKNNSFIKNSKHIVDLKYIKNKEDINFKTEVAKNFFQIGYMSYDKNNNNNTKNYIQHLSKNLLTKQITNWLNQYGNIKIQLDLNKVTNVDLLLPIFDKTNKILFTQIGFRTIKDRNISNIGVGYRKYKNDLMWGINSFYDYDLTGKNSRLGIGYELWFDYLKFTNNAYFRLTDWHQSNLHDTQDYDERPANGFDLILEGFLPTNIQLSTFIKYEHYFYNNLNDNIMLNNDFKQKISTLGINYTPIPLITLKGEISNAKFKKNNLNLELTYKFGLPLNEQLNPNNVKIIRNLYTNKYDFIDRNYNIVIEYNKQELIIISLPNFIITKNNLIIPIEAKIHKSKYKIKNIFWSAPELIAQGSKIEKTSLNNINLILSDYIFKKTNKIQKYYLSATAFDTKGNKSNVATMSIYLTNPQKTIKSLILYPNEILFANNKDYYIATFAIQNENGEPIKNQNITFTITNFFDNNQIFLNNIQYDTNKKLILTTDQNGKIYIKIKSKIPGQGILKASMRNGEFIDTILKFQEIENEDCIIKLSLIQNTSIANGKDKNIVIATIEDKYGNPIKNTLLNISITNNAIITNKTKTTDDKGQITIPFTNTNPGESILTISYKKNIKNISTQFLPINDKIKISSVKLVDNNTRKTANKINTFTYLVTVVDYYNNPVEDIIIEPHVNKKNVLIESINKTNKNGEATLVLNNHGQEVKDIIVSAQLKNSSISVNANKIVSFNLPILNGIVINATDYKHLDNVKVDIYSDDNNTLSKTLYTNNDGSFKTELPVGNYTLKFFLSGFINLTRKITLNDNSEINFPMSLDFKNKNISGRIILNWNKKPNDLDAHLYVPIKNNSDRVEIFFDQKEANEANAILDIDKQTAPGVETISLLKLNTGRYLYFVHNCEDSSSNGNLEATVTINLNDGQTKTFTPPPKQIKARECWVVFELDTRSNINIIKTINSISMCP